MSLTDITAVWSCSCRTRSVSASICAHCGVRARMQSSALDAAVATRSPQPRTIVGYVSGQYRCLLVSKRESAVFH